MIAIGCLAPIMLGAAGVLTGNWLAGSAGAIWGGIAGLVGGGIILGAIGWLLSRIRQ